MKNCIVAQSGGPTAVINASVVGVVEGNREARYFDRVYGGINGIEGILEKRIINLSDIGNEDLAMLKYTPSSALGSCRYKMKDFTEGEAEYNTLFNIMDELEADTLFYIGGNDSMDTVSKLSEYTKLKGLKKQIIGIPKTIDNDLFHTDHTPGFGSAAKYIAITTLEAYLDSSVYTNNGIFILETMGRDTGWLAASSVLAKVADEPIVDFIYLPEVAFSKERFLIDVKNKFNEKKKVFIVVSEGLKDERGKYLYDTDFTSKHDRFSHVQLGGVGSYLKNLIIEEGITPRVKVLELMVTQRCAMHSVSQTDIEEAYMVGKDAVEYAAQGDTGFMVGINRLQGDPYQVETIKVEASKVANHIKYFPTQWITPEGNHVTTEAIAYIKPLVMGTPQLIMENGLPKYIQLY